MGALVLLLVLQLAAACSQDGRPQTYGPTDLSASAGNKAWPTLNADDTDHDGLCDLTEARLRTNAQAVDSDGDGLPDTTEVVAGYDPSDPTSPGLDQVGYLMAMENASLDFELRATVDGNGTGATGDFNAKNSFDPDGLRASDFFVGAVAVGAEPPDNVRGIEATSERFTVVYGPTRLSFRLHFAYSMAARRNCAVALPFEYSVKSDVTAATQTRDYLLIVTPKTTPTPDEFCRPIACL